MANKFIIQKAHWNSDQVHLINVRTQVFVEEQQVPHDIEIDGKDAECSHVKALNSGGEVIGTARLLPTNYIGRMCVLKAYRHLGIGAEMLSYFINYARQNQIPSLIWLLSAAKLAFLSHNIWRRMLIPPCYWLNYP